MDVHTFDNLDKNDLKKLFKLKQPIKLNHKVQSIDITKLDTIFSKKEIDCVNIKTGKIKKSKWKNDIKCSYCICSFNSSRNSFFKPIL